MPDHLLHDIFEPTLTPLLRLKPAFMLRDGIYTPIERAAKLAQHFKVRSQRSAAELDLLIAANELEARISWQHEIAGQQLLQPAWLISNIRKHITADIALLDSDFNPPREALQIEGNNNQIYLHAAAAVSPFAVLDTRNGPVVIDAHAKIGAFCHIAGPVYIGRHTQLDHCHFSNAIAGINCRLGGEISDSIIGNFSNKHHDGFLGHSLVGDWVNLGALTTTSDLKNNYGSVSLHFAATKYETSTIKFGAIIGDHVKTAIGTLLNTGSVIDFGSNLFADTRYSGYVPPLQWGNNEKYEMTRFLDHAARMMQRRGQQWNAAQIALVQKI